MPVTNDIALLHARVDELHALISPLLPKSSVKAELQSTEPAKTKWKAYTGMHISVPLFAPDTYIDVLFSDGLMVYTKHYLSFNWAILPGRRHVVAYRESPEQ